MVVLSNIAMKLKSKRLIFFLLPFLIFSCKKEAEKKPDSTTPKTKTEMLSSVTWKYNEYFINYNENNTILAYKPGKANNLYDLSKSRLNYNIDNTYQETLETGTKVSGNWKFTNSETLIELKINQQIVNINVVYIDNNNFQWINSNGDIFGRMVPAGN